MLCAKYNLQSERTFETPSKSDSKRHYKNLYLLGHPMGNSITFMNRKILGFLCF